MGGSSLGPFHGASGFHGQNRFFGCHFGGHPHESVRIPQAFDIGDDYPGAVVFTQVVNDIRDGYITGIAVGGINAGADPHLGKRLVDDLGHPSAECHDGDITRIRHGEGKIAVGPDVRIGVDDSLTVGA